MNMKLNLEQSICSARIFLNTMGLILDDVENIDINNKLNIYDLNNNVVGTLIYDNNEIRISGEYNNTILEANYVIPEIPILVDRDDNNTLFGMWYSNIIFLLKNNDTTITGEFYIASFVDNKYGNLCKCQPVIKVHFSNDSELTLKILRDGRFFGLDISSQDYNEKIDMKPFHKSTDLIVHNITKGKYDSENQTYPYRFYSGIFSEFDETLTIYLDETEYEQCINHIHRSEKNYTSDIDAIQIGNMMRSIDTSMYKKIKQLQKILTIGNISLFDNLISVCYDKYQNEEIEALLGIEKKVFSYQNGSSDLTSSYYAIDKNDPFNLSKNRKIHRKSLKPLINN